LEGRSIGKGERDEGMEGERRRKRYWKDRVLIGEEERRWKGHRKICFKLSLLPVQ